MQTLAATLVLLAAVAVAVALSFAHVATERLLNRSQRGCDRSGVFHTAVPMTVRSTVRAAALLDAVARALETPGHDRHDRAVVLYLDASHRGEIVVASCAGDGFRAVFTARDTAVGAVARYEVLTWRSAEGVVRSRPQMAEVRARVADAVRSVDPAAELRRERDLQAV